MSGGVLCSLLGSNIGLVHSHWSRNVEAWLLLVESFIVLKYFMVLQRQLSYAIKIQLKEYKMSPDMGGILCLSLFFLAKG